MSLPAVNGFTERPSAQLALFCRSSPKGLPSSLRLALTVRTALTALGKTPYSVATLRKDTPDSICFTSLGHCCGTLPQVVQRQISSLSISVKPKVASRTILRILKLLTLFHGQTASHNPHWKHLLNASPPLALMTSMISLYGVTVSTVFLPLLSA